METLTLCSKSKCTQTFPAIDASGRSYSTCEQCQEKDRVGTAKRRKRKRDEAAHPLIRPVPKAPVISGAEQAGNEQEGESPEPHGIPVAEPRGYDGPNNENDSDGEASAVSMSYEKYIRLLTIFLGDRIFGQSSPFQITLEQL